MKLQSIREVSLVLSLGLGFASVAWAKQISVQSASVSRIREVSAQPAACPLGTRYRFTALPNPIGLNIDSIYSGVDMNSSGIVTARLHSPTIGTVDFLWNSRTSSYLETRLQPSQRDLRTLAISDRNELMGRAGLPTWRQVPAVRNTQGVLEYLLPEQMFEGATEAWLRAIQSSGAVVGDAYFSSQPTYSSAFYSADRQNFHLIPSHGATFSSATAVNDRGFAVGQLVYRAPDVPETQRSFLYSASSRQSVILSGMEAYSAQRPVAINRSNQVLVSTSSNYVLWSSSGQRLLDLVSFGPASLNDSGHFVGTEFTGNTYQAVVHKAGQRLVLDDALSHDVDLVDFSIYQALKINNSGEILVKYAHRPTVGNPDGYYVYRYGVVRPQCR